VAQDTRRSTVTSLFPCSFQLTVHVKTPMAYPHSGPCRSESLSTCYFIGEKLRKHTLSTAFLARILRFDLTDLILALCSSMPTFQIVDPSLLRASTMTSILITDLSCLRVITTSEIQHRLSAHCPLRCNTYRKARNVRTLVALL